MSIVLNFKETVNQTLVVEKGLKLILWAGDCLHNGITDIERLPMFDVYVCYGFPEGLQTNIDYLTNRSMPGILCVLDIDNPEQVERFLAIFKGKCAHIDSDYNGNTPTLSLDLYNKLLSEDGRAYNIEGINGAVMPTEEYQNTLELFAPMLDPELNLRRSWTDDLLELAKDNGLCPAATWKSPDLNIPYYDTIRRGQERFMKWQEHRNPMKFEIYLYTEETLEDYWSKLPVNLLSTNIERVSKTNLSLSGIIDKIMPRFKEFLIRKIPCDTNQILSVSDIQTLYRQYTNVSAFHGLIPSIGNYTDIRNEDFVYGLCSQKNSAVN